MGSRGLQTASVADGANIIVIVLVISLWWVMCYACSRKCLYLYNPIDCLLRYATYC